MSESQSLQNGSACNGSSPACHGMVPFVRFACDRCVEWEAEVKRIVSGQAIEQTLK